MELVESSFTEELPKVECFEWSGGDMRPQEADVLSPGRRKVSWEPEMCR